MICELKGRIIEICHIRIDVDKRLTFAVVKEEQEKTWYILYTNIYSTVSAK